MKQMLTCRIFENYKSLNRKYAKSDLEINIAAWQLEEHWLTLTMKCPKSQYIIYQLQIENHKPKWQFDC